MNDLTWLHLALKISFTKLIRPLLIALISTGINSDFFFVHSSNTQETRFTENYTDGYFGFLSWRAQLWCAGELRYLLDIRFSSVLFSHSIHFLSTPNHLIYFSCFYRIDFLFKSHSLCIHNVRMINTRSISWPGLKVMHKYSAKWSTLAESGWVSKLLFQEATKENEKRVSRLAFIFLLFWNEGILYAQADKGLGRQKQDWWRAVVFGCESRGRRGVRGGGGGF